MNASYNNNHKYVYAVEETRKILEKGDTYPKNGDVPDESKILEVFCVKGTCKEDNEVIITGASPGMS